MRNLAKQLKLNSATWSLVGGLMLVGLLGACTEVQVTVDTCATRTGGGTPLPPIEPGGCAAGVPYTGTIPSGTICKNTSGTIITCPANATCSSGSMKCPSLPGTCANRTPCKTTWTESTHGSTSGTCVCGGC